jgi:hypothetical protein
MVPRGRTQRTSTKSKANRQALVSDQGLFHYIKSNTITLDAIAGRVAP